jgi:hypothetical protein
MCCSLVIIDGPVPKGKEEILGEIGFGDVDWIHLAQDRDRWQAVVNMVMNLWVP